MERYFRLSELSKQQPKDKDLMLLSVWDDSRKRYYTKSCTVDMLKQMVRTEFENIVIDKLDAIRQEISDIKLKLNADSSKEDQEKHIKKLLIEKFSKMTPEEISSLGITAISTGDLAKILGIIIC